MTDGQSRPGHNLKIVEGAVLEVAVELHPTHLAAEDLLRRIVSQGADALEIETTRQAIGNLRDLGILRERNDGRLEPTQPTLRTAGLLTGLSGC